MTADFHTFQPSFQQKLKEDLKLFLDHQSMLFPQEDLLRIDLHCHDYNSNVTDELLGRILNVPETWVSSKTLIEQLKKNKCNAFTITNHNNARSCYELQAKGVDVLTAAEFSCWVPDFSIGIHVLAYGFTPEQELRLNKLRKNVYAFQEYARLYNIPTIWAHPLYHYAVKEMPPMDFFNKMVLIFERFEMLNGQRDTWQNILVKEWLDQITPQCIDRFAVQYDVDPKKYCINPYKKCCAGGSDSHMGLFAGMTGSLLYVPKLKERLKNTPASQLALEAIRDGNIVPYGSHQNTEKLTIAFLSYVCQVAMNYKDPGLVRLLLHKGDTQDKMIALLIGNTFSEVQKHKVTMSFVKLFHNCLQGRKPSFIKKLIVPSAYKPVFDEASKIADHHKKNKVNLIDKYYEAIESINAQLNHVLFSRLEKKMEQSNSGVDMDSEAIVRFIEQLELPSNFRSYLNNKNVEGELNISAFLDGLSFPFFASLFILSAHFASAKAMFHTRPFLKQFAKNINKYEHPKRILWLTDTFEDKNGVSMFLREMHKEVKRRNLPIDILVCSSTLASDDHLKVLTPVSEFKAPLYSEQKINVPNFVELHNLFLHGEYDSVVCSTEGVMGICALYLKQAYSVPVNFYMHTDWLMFAKKTLNIQGANLHRVQRMMRLFYKSFDRVFVLNSDQKKWLTGSRMSLNADSVFQTAHWTNAHFGPRISNKDAAFQIAEAAPVLLYVGRVSEEKGVLELPYIFDQVRRVHLRTQLVIVGSGPMTEKLKAELPEAHFIPWVEQEQLPAIYSSADILILPSWFDTFCNVVLESLSCGLPVVAYNSKGPKDIINHNENGFLVTQKSEMAECIIGYLSNKEQQVHFKESAIARSKDYSATCILNQFMKDVDLL